MVLPDGELVWLGARPDGGDDVEGYDLRGAVIGCEGMFGVITRVLVRPIRAPQAYKTMLGVFENVEDASQSVSAIIAAGILPGALEMMDQIITRRATGASGGNARGRPGSCHRLACRVATPDSRDCAP